MLLAGLAAGLVSELAAVLPGPVSELVSELAAVLPAALPGVLAAVLPVVLAAVLPAVVTSLPLSFSLLTTLVTPATTFFTALPRNDSLIKSSKDSTPRASASLFCNKPGIGSFFTLLLYCFAPLTPRPAILPTNLPINACFRSSVLIKFNPTIWLPQFIKLS